MSWTHGNMPPYQKINQVHFRKHISKKLLLRIINSCPNLQKISVSKSASKRISEEMFEILERENISILISKNLGRPCSFELNKIRGMKMSYANPDHKEEYAFVKRLVDLSKESMLPIDFFKKLNELYGEPSKNYADENFFSKIEQTAFRLNNPWEFNFREGYSILGYKELFPQIRRIIFQEFYCGKEGFEKIRHYWKKQRKNACIAQCQSISPVNLGSRVKILLQACDNQLNLNILK